VSAMITMAPQRARRRSRGGSSVVIVWPWERLKMLHNPNYRPSLQLHHDTVTYSRACRDVERGLAEWCGPYLARIPKAPEVPKRNKRHGNLLYRCVVCGGGDRRRLCVRCRIDGIKGAR
jgi:hypothetical protein